MAKVFAIYTLRPNSDGTLDGPLNKRVIGTFGTRREAFAMAKREASKRGYGQKPTYFLADGSRAIWSLQQESFPLATACVDWFHVYEYHVVRRRLDGSMMRWAQARSEHVLALRCVVVNGLLDHYAEEVAM